MTRQAVWQVLLSPHDAFGYVQHDDDYSFLLTTRHDRTIGATTEHGRYNLDGQNILLEMYHLATIFYASKPLSELTNLDPKFKDPLGDMMELCETTEAYRALSFSIGIRHTPPITSRRPRFQLAQSLGRPPRSEKTSRCVRRATRSFTRAVPIFITRAAMNIAVQPCCLR